MNDNLDVAVLILTNELASRYGVKPFEFVAVFRDDASSGKKWSLEFESYPRGNELRADRFEAMLRTLGIGAGDNAILQGASSEIYNALEHAIDVAPPVGRHR